MISNDSKQNDEQLIESIVLNLVEELKDKLESQLDGKTMINSYSDLSIVNAQLKKLMGPSSSSEDSSSSSSSSSSTSSSDDDDENGTKTKPKKVIRRVTKPVASSSDTDSDDDDPKSGRQRANAPKYVKTKDEITPDEMPPPEFIDITLDEKAKLNQLGRVLSRVDKLIVVKSTGVSVPLDEDTVLFDAKRKSIGKIFETFGPVAAPFYSIRFQTSDEIEQRGLALDIDASVFYAPDKTEYTKFIFNVDEMRREKGSDASWQHDNEPPRECIDYSDDEKERAAKKALAKKKKGDDEDNGEDDDDDDSSSDDQKGTLKRGQSGPNMNANKKKTGKHSAATKKPTTTSTTAE